MGKSELEEKIRDYCIDEGILGKSLPTDEKLEFGYEINFPPNNPHPMKILLLKMKDRKAIALQLATQVAPPHIEGLKKISPDGVGFFFNLVKKIMLQQNLLYNIDVQNARYIISETLYPDGLTEDRFYLIIRRIFNTSLYINTLLQELLESKGAILKGGTKGLDDFSLGGGNSMYT
jgi:hypothetical protein